MPDSLFDTLLEQLDDVFASLQDAVIDSTTAAIDLGQRIGEFGRNAASGDFTIPTPVADFTTTTVIAPQRSWPRRHPLLVAAAVVGLTSTAFYAYKVMRRPKLMTRGTSRHAIVVLGADRGSLGRSVAMDLAERGFFVVVSVSTVAEAIRFQASSKLQAFALDPFVVLPCSAALSTNSSASQPSLVAVVDAFALAESSSLLPLEATPLSLLSQSLTARALTPVGILQGLLPIMRQRSNGVAPVVLSLAHAPTSRLALPFLASASAADAASLALQDALRRENPQVRVQLLEVGFFARHDDAALVQSRVQELPAHLRTVYATALGHAASLSTRKGHPVQELHERVFDIVRGRSTSRRQGVGAGGTWLCIAVADLSASTYRIASLLPTFLVDWLLSVQSRLSSDAPSDQSFIAPANETEVKQPRRPLPTPPSEDDASEPGVASSIASLSDEAGYSMIHDA